MECPGKTNCGDGDNCFAELARERARGVDILVVNHALYCAHLSSRGNVLPDHDVVILDEAHAFADNATSAFGANANRTTPNQPPGGTGAQTAAQAAAQDMSLGSRRSVRPTRISRRLRNLVCWARFLPPLFDRRRLSFPAQRASPSFAATASA